MLRRVFQFRVGGWAGQMLGLNQQYPVWEFEKMGVAIHETIGYTKVKFNPDKVDR